MDQNITKVEPGGQEENEEVIVTPNWSELNPDLLRCVLNRLSFTSLNQGKLVCSSWYSAGKSCVPNQNQIPWLILFPLRGSGRCILFVPDDTENLYRTRDFGANFFNIHCLATCGSWLLLTNVAEKFYILNPLTGERINLPVKDAPSFKYYLPYEQACFWIDNKTKDYLIIVASSRKFTKKGYNNWQDIDLRKFSNVFYNDKNQKLYVHHPNLDALSSISSIWQNVYHVDNNVHVWDFSGDKPRNTKVSLPNFYINPKDYRSFLEENNISMVKFISRMAITVSGDLLMVSWCKEPWCFRIYKINKMDNKWVQIESLGDEALIFDMSICVIANGSIPGIKRNSIYFNNKLSRDPHDIFVYDLTTHKKEPLPQCVYSVINSLRHFRARWFFPC